MIRISFLFALLCTLGIGSSNGEDTFALTPIPQMEQIPVGTAIGPLQGPLPVEFSLRSHFPIPGDQGSADSCAAFATAYAVKTYQEKIERGWQLAIKGQINDTHVFSPAFIYNQVPRHGGKVYLRDALDLLVTHGCCPLSSMPYHDSSPQVQPTNEAFDVATEYKCLTYARVLPTATTLLKRFLATGTPVIVSIEHDQSFKNLKGKGSWANYDGTPKHLHALVLIGYSSSRNAFEVANSFGTDWGDNGFGWIDYSQYKTSVREAFTITDIHYPKELRGDELSKKLMDFLIKSLQPKRFNGKIDDTRDNKKLNVKVGIVGVEYLLDDAVIQIESVSAKREQASGLGSSTTITVTFSTAGEYREKHFRGVGSENHTKHETWGSTRIRATYAASPTGIQEKNKEILLKGPHRSTEVLAKGASEQIQAALSKFE